MDVNLMVRFLAWCSVVNVALLMVWFFSLVVAKDLLYGIQGRWFNVSREILDAMNYGGLGLFKIGVWLFNLTPYLVLRELV